VIVGGQGKWKTYGCATHRDVGKHACSNALTAKLPVVEYRLLRRIRVDLLNDEVAAEVDQRYANALAKRPKAATHGPRIATLTG
jgi:hypothetical protein